MLIVAGLASRCACCRTAHVDDAFITFRYARNIVEERLRLQPRRADAGHDHTLYTLLMAGIGGSPAATRIPGSRCRQRCRRCDHRRAAGVAGLACVGAGDRGGNRRALWAVSPMSVTFAVGGMETSVAVLWMVAAMAACCLRAGRVDGRIRCARRADADRRAAVGGPLLLHHAWTTWRAQATPGAGLIRRIPGRPGRSSAGC